MAHYSFADPAYEPGPYGPLAIVAMSYRGVYTNTRPEPSVHAKIPLQTDAW